VEPMDPRERKCTKHPQTPVTSECHFCGAWVCFLCAVDFRDVTYCSMRCAERDGTQAPAEDGARPSPSAEEAAAVCASHPKSPSVAACRKCGNGACTMCAIQNSEGTFCSQDCAERGTQVRHRSTRVTRAIAKIAEGFGHECCAAHPRKPAAVLCDNCGRHACEECKVKAPWGMFCSLECFAWFRDNRARQNLGGRRRKSRRGRAWVGVGAMVVIAGGAALWAKHAWKPAPSVLASASVLPAETPRNGESEPSKKSVEALPPADPPPYVAPKPPDEPRVKPAEPPPKPAEPKPHLELARDPWGPEPVGTWYRVRERADREERFRDVGLAKREKDRVVLVQQTMTAQGRDFEVRFPAELEEIAVVGNVRLTLHGLTQEFDLVQSKLGLGRTWVVSAGRYAGATFVDEWKGRRLSPRRFAEETLVVQGRTFACLMIESDVGGTADVMKVWISPNYPLGPVRFEVEGLLIELVDLGRDWLKRPPFPLILRDLLARAEPQIPKLLVEPDPPAVRVEPPKPPPEDGPKAKVEKELAEAARLIREATPDFREAFRAAEAPPADPSALRALVERAEGAREKLLRAKALYKGLEGDAPDPQATERRIRQLSEVLATLEVCLQKLRP